MTASVSLDRQAWTPVPRPVVGLRRIRRAAMPAVALFTMVAVLATAVVVSGWLTQPRRPFAFYRSESPLRLSGLGSGLTEAFRLDGGRRRVAWSAFTEWGCILRMELLPEGGATPIPLADAQVSTTAAGSADLRELAPGPYTLRIDSGCAWTVTFGPD